MAETDERTREELLEHYKIAVEEYRFQVGLNWGRTQYLLVFNVAIVAAGAALVRLEVRTVEVMAGTLFLVGCLCALASLFVTFRQHAYYQAARDQVVLVGALLGLGEQGRPPALGTTKGLRGEKGGPKVRHAIAAILVVVAGVDLAAALYLFIWVS